MSKITFGDQMDSSKSGIKITTEGTSKTDIRVGEMKNNSQRFVEIIDRTGKGGAEPIFQSSTLLTGSFYLVTFIIIIAVIATVASKVSWWALPLIIVSTMLSVSLIGAFELRKSEKLKEENFLKLMLKIFGFVPQILKFKK
jgi:hypothetical protein